MKKTTALSTLCKILENKKSITMKSEIEIAREEVGNYIKKDTDKYIQLKAEVESEPSATESCCYVFSLLSFAVAALAFIFSVFSVVDKIAAAILVILALIVELLVALRMLRYFSPINRWRTYILAVINEFNPKEIPEESKKSN